MEVSEKLCGTSFPSGFKPQQIGILPQSRKCCKLRGSFLLYTYTVLALYIKICTNLCQFVPLHMGKYKSMFLLACAMHAGEPNAFV